MLAPDTGVVLIPELGDTLVDTEELELAGRGAGSRAGAIGARGRGPERRRRGRAGAGQTLAVPLVADGAGVAAHAGGLAGPALATALAPRSYGGQGTAGEGAKESCSLHLGLCVSGRGVRWEDQSATVRVLLLGRARLCACRSLHRYVRKGSSYLYVCFPYSPSP